MVKAPTGLNKTDMYDYINQLSNEKIQELTKNYNVLIKDLISKQVKKMSPMINNMSTHVTGLRHYYQELLEGYAWVTKVSDLYHIQSLLYRSGHGPEDKMIERIERSIQSRLCIGHSENLRHRSNPLYSYQEEVDEEFYAEYVKYWNKAKQDITDIITLQKELTQIVKAEVYPPNAWRDLQAVGLDLVPLRNKVLAKEAKPPMQLKTSVDINILNK